MLSKWINLNKQEIDNVPNEPGAYKIAVFDDKNKPITINRFFEKDYNGIIDIGESVHLRARLNSFLINISSDSTGHMAGWRYRKLKLYRHFHNLKFCYVICTTKPEAYRMEHQLLKAYQDKHKELPPLNYKYNWSEEE
jgi:excinuclease UvrABC nuclease subunit